MARPRVLDDVKKGEITALLSAGMSMASIARYVDCDRKTIKRERTVDEDFDLRVRRAEMAVQLKPLQAIQRKADTHWRAAAWLLDRQEKRRLERQARRDAANSADKVTLTRVELVKLAGQVKDAVLCAAVFREDEAYLGRKIDQAFVNLVPELAAKPDDTLPPYEPAWWPRDYAPGEKTSDFATSDAAADSAHASSNDASGASSSDASKDAATDPPVAPPETMPETLPPMDGPVVPPKWVPPRGQTWQQSARNLEKLNPARYGKRPAPGPVVDWEALQKFRDDLIGVIRKQRAESASASASEPCGEQRGGTNSSESLQTSEKAAVCQPSPTKGPGSFGPTNLDPGSCPKTSELK
ncbi:helix-turn-helix domain-containing protein [Aeoliella sp. ICT_H6.2]|uniref:Helix-turn-helix domain-containing protein n=1 Tax=Aeoliella straminimaris TaxID=2954799 RepID=A0A9X2JJT9_9BACT|nr:helix-turn-helix domain-containing protein [Aeoliella straminimaris]MCO6048027.1 helix-turn-helix domain-containing protein [Aeoliella straminimaris]